MAFRYSKFNQSIFQQTSVPDIAEPEYVPTKKIEKKTPKPQKKSKFVDVSSDEEETIFDWVIDNKPSTNKFRKLLKNHIEEIIEINDNI